MKRLCFSACIVGLLLIGFGLHSVHANTQFAHIFTIKSDGTGRVDVTPIDNTNWSSPSLRADGLRIAASAGDPPQVMTMDLNGGNQIQVTNERGTSRNPVWHGNQVVYEGNRFGDWDIYAKNADGTNSEVQVAGPNAFEPEFSPDGASLAYVQIDAQNVAHIVVANVDGSNPKTITTIAGVSSPSWCATSMCLSYVLNNNQIYTISARPTWAHTDLTFNLATGDTLANLERAHFPGLNSLAYSYLPSAYALGDYTEVHVLKGTVDTKITTGWMPSWNFAGTTLVFVDSAGGNPDFPSPLPNKIPTQAPTATAVSTATPVREGHNFLPVIEYQKAVKQP